MAWADKKDTTAALLRNWSLVYAGNFIGAVATASGMLNCLLPSGAAVGDEVVVVVRPEDVQVSPSDGAAENIVVGEVMAAMFMGDYKEVWHFCKSGCN